MGFHACGWGKVSENKWVRLPFRGYEINSNAHSNSVIWDVT